MNLKLTTTALSLIMCLGMNPTIAADQYGRDMDVGRIQPNITIYKEFRSNPSGESVPSNTSSAPVNLVSNSTALSSDLVLAYRDYVGVRVNVDDSDHVINLLNLPDKAAIEQLERDVIELSRSGKSNLAKQVISMIDSETLQGKLYIKAGLYEEAFNVWFNNAWIKNGLLNDGWFDRKGQSISESIVPDDRYISKIFHLSNYDLGVAVESAVKDNKMGSAFAFLLKMTDAQDMAEIMQKLGLSGQKGR